MVGPGAGYIPERIKVITAGFQEDMEKIRLEFVRFKKAQGIVWQLDIARQTTLPFLQATDQELLLRNKIDEEDRALNANDVSHQGGGCL